MTFNHFHPAQPASREGAALPHPARSVAPYAAILAATGALALSRVVTERWAVALAAAALFAAACAGAASWLRRMQLCDLADRFIALGAGAPPPAAVLRERRAVLVSTAERRALARSIRGFLRMAQSPPRTTARLPVDRRAVLADAALLARLADELDAVSTPVSARSVALVHMLITDAGSPVYGAGTPGDDELHRRLNQILFELERGV